MLNIPFLSGAKNPVAKRCENDLNTRLRLKYAPYYHQIDAARGAEVQCEGKWMVMMSSNEYLGLSQHPKVKAASEKAVQEWGTSPCGSRLANGNRKYHVELEEALAAFLGKESCHVLTAGYLACMASLSSLAQRNDAVIVDKSIHSALWDGVSLCSGTVERFTHEDMDSLEKLLRKLDPDQPKIIVVDGVYSMEGHVASLPRLTELAVEFKAFVIVDDAHGFGVLGEKGQGAAHHCGVEQNVDMIVGSFSKALASTGGFIAGSKGTIEYLRTSCRQIIFSAGPTPGASAAATAALGVLQSEPQHREKLWDNTRHLQGLLAEAGLDYWESPTPAIPVVIGDTEKCYKVWKHLWDDGFFTVMSVAPGVPAGKDLIRCAASALHSHEQLERFVVSLKKACQKAGVTSK